MIHKRSMGAAALCLSLAAKAEDAKKYPNWDGMGSAAARSACGTRPSPEASGNRRP
jgi:hypothetical protein